MKAERIADWQHWTPPQASQRPAQSNRLLNPLLWDSWNSPLNRLVLFALVFLSFTSSDQRVLFSSHQSSSGPGGTHLGGATGWKTQWPSHIWLIYCCFYFSQWNLASCFYFCSKTRWSWRGMVVVSPTAVILSEGHRGFICSSRRTEGLKHLIDASDASNCSSIVEESANEAQWLYLWNVLPQHVHGFTLNEADLSERRIF